MFIRTAQHHPPVAKLGYRHWVERLATARWPGARINWAAARGEATAQVIRSNWVAVCPFCAGGILIQPGEPFFCPDCMMQGNGFLPMGIRWPENRTAIEAVLVQRPNPMNRNWYPWESVDVLTAENLEHDIPTP